MTAFLARDIPGRVLAVYAHPDDAEVSCGGTLARWSGGGAEVHLVICTQGDKGSADPTTDPAELVGRRAIEVAEAAGLLGVTSYEVLGIADGELEDSRQVRGVIVAAIRRLKPDIVICPDPTAILFGDSYVNHRDHRVAGLLTLDAVSPAAANPHYFPDAGPPHAVSSVFLSGTLDPNVWVEVSDTLDTKIDALLCHRSQLGGAAAGQEGGSPEWLTTVVRQRAVDGGAVAGVALAEGFRRMRMNG